MLEGYVADGAANKDDDDDEDEEDDDTWRNFVREESSEASLYFIFQIL